MTKDQIIRLVYFSNFRGGGGGRKCFWVLGVMQDLRSRSKAGWEYSCLWLGERCVTCAGSATEMSPAQRIRPEWLIRPLIVDWLGTHIYMATVCVHVCVTRVSRTMTVPATVTSWPHCDCLASLWLAGLLVYRASKTQVDIVINVSFRVSYRD